MSAEARCRGCNKLICWGTTAEGKKIPLDPAPAIYELGELGLHGPLVAKTKQHQFMVSHFATCPDASRFSASAKAAVAEKAQP